MLTDAQIRAVITDSLLASLRGEEQPDQRLFKIDVQTCVDFSELPENPTYEQVCDFIIGQVSKRSAAAEAALMTQVTAAVRYLMDVVMKLATDYGLACPTVDVEDLISGFVPPPRLQVVRQGESGTEHTRSSA